MIKSLLTMEVILLVALSQIVSGCYMQEYTCSSCDNPNRNLYSADNVCNRITVEKDPFVGFVSDTEVVVLLRSWVCEGNLCYMPYNDNSLLHLNDITTVGGKDSVPGFISFSNKQGINVFVLPVGKIYEIKISFIGEFWGDSGLYEYVDSSFKVTLELRDEFINGIISIDLSRVKAEVDSVGFNVYPQLVLIDICKVKLPFETVE